MQETVQGRGMELLQSLTAPLSQVSMCSPTHKFSDLSFLFFFFLMEASLHRHECLNSFSSLPFPGRWECEGLKIPSLKLLHGQFCCYMVGSTCFRPQAGSKSPLINIKKCLFYFLTQEIPRILVPRNGDEDQICISYYKSYIIASHCPSFSTFQNEYFQ